MRRGTLAAGVALAVGGAASLIPLPNSFEATAIVAVDEASAALRSAAARGGADLAGSKSVVARAAASLNGTILPPSAPTWLERIGTVSGAKAALNAPARLSALLGDATSARPADGLVEIRGVASDAATASRFAAAVAEALVAEEGIAFAAAARQRESAASERADTARAALRVALDRFTALGGSETDPAEAIAAAAAATRAAEARLGDIRAVIAAGQPPLGAGSELPASIAALQQTYWDQRKQFDIASATLGERHTTVVTLRDGVSRAAASLTAEWAKIERAAANAADVVRSREAVLRKAAATPDAAARARIDEARSAVVHAKAAMASAVSEAAAPAPPMPFRLVAAALSVEQRPQTGKRMGLVSGFATLAFAVAFWAPVRSRLRRVPRPWQATSSAVSNDAADGSSLAQDEPTFAYESDPGGAHAEPSYPSPVMPAAVIRSATEVDLPDDAHAGFASADGEAGFESKEETLSLDVRAALHRIAAGFEDVSPTRYGVPSVMVAARAAGIETGVLALALAEAAADLGFRVLLIETEREDATLAAAVAPAGEPMLVDAFAALRVVLPAERTAGLFLAPALHEGARIAAALARNTEAAIIEDLAVAFDVMVIDGGDAIEAAAGGWRADRYLHAEQAEGRAEDMELLETLETNPSGRIWASASDRFANGEGEVTLGGAGEVAARPAPRTPSWSAARRRTSLPGGPLRVASRRVVAR